MFGDLKWVEHIPSHDSFFYSFFFSFSPLPLLPPLERGEGITRAPRQIITMDSTISTA